MAYAVLIVAGLIAGFFIPRRPRALINAALLAAVYVAVVTLYAVAHNHGVSAALSFFLLPERVPDNEPGLGALVVGAGVWIISVVVAALRCMFFRNRPSGEVPNDRAA
ncbi:MAG: hypothetical protein A3H27_14975 [Acidobacteria bacterium RIFCSPLOWO2_02_FULL_59_13]|nr:MAG: hypothetical protein A3H27_14975 [Acidobacteria bacterium RIFCSPLOWO2_02_FULL_59_13]